MIAALQISSKINIKIKRTSSLFPPLSLIHGFRTNTMLNYLLQCSSHANFHTHYVYMLGLVLNEECFSFQ